MTILQFDVIRNPMPRASADKPFLVCIQHRRLDHFRTRILVPLIANTKVGESRLNPAFTIEGKFVCLDPTDLVTLPVMRLGEAIANLESERNRIIAALDLVFTGI